MGLAIGVDVSGQRALVEKPSTASTTVNYNDFIIREDIGETDGDYGWNIIFLSGYLEKGCHEISVIGQNEQEIIEQDERITICRNE